jgi:hypothetical protein
MNLNKNAPEGAGYEIEWALLCDRVTENEDGTLRLDGVAHRLRKAFGFRQRKTFVIKILGGFAGDAIDDRSRGYFGELKLLITPPSKLASHTSLEGTAMEWSQNIMHESVVTTDQIYGRLIDDDVQDIISSL